jgi:hypothetical protein
VFEHLRAASLRAAQEVLLFRMSTSLPESSTSQTPTSSEDV